MKPGEKKAVTESRKNMEPFFFESVDKGSAMPSWYHSALKEEEQDWVENTERQLDADLIPSEVKPRVKAELNARKAKLEKVKASERRAKELVNENKDKYAKRYAHLGEKIAESMFTRDQMFRRGHDRSVSPREEAERMAYRTPLIQEWKTIGKILGEETNPETLRK